MSVISKVLPILRNNKHYELVASAVTYCRSNSRLYSTDKGETGIAKATPAAEVSTDVRPLGEKIKETTKTVSYTGVILAGVGVTGIIFYYVFRELFSGSSANSVYSKALAKCKDDPRVEDSLGAPLRGFGEETSRRRRTHVTHVLYERDGVSCMRMKFYIKGTRNQATVDLDAMQNESGNYEYRYLIVQLEDYSRRVIVIEDNRAELDKKKPMAGSGGLSTIVDSSLPTLNLSQ